MCAKFFFQKSTYSSYASRYVRVWADEWLGAGLLPTSKRGSHIKTPLLIEGKDLRDSCLVYLRSQASEKRGITILHFQRWIEEKLLTVVLGCRKKSVSLRTCYYWMARLGFSLGKFKKVVYYDGHEV
jgi:hypothetical protein